MSPSKQQLRTEWAQFGNGLLHSIKASVLTAIGSSTVLGALSGLHWISDESAWTGIAAAFLGGLWQGVYGYMQKHDLPDLFVTEKTIVTTVTEVTENVTKE